MASSSRSVLQGMSLHRLGSGTRPPTLRERDLPGHLRGDGEIEPSATAAVTPEASEELDDFAVREALDLLKGLSVFRKSVGQAD